MELVRTLILGNDEKSQRVVLDHVIRYYWKPALSLEFELINGTSQEHQFENEEKFTEGLQKVDRLMGAVVL
jgi:hypothetical protein